MKRLRWVILLGLILVGCQVRPDVPQATPTIKGDSSYNIGTEAVQKADMKMIEQHLNDADTSNDALLQLAKDMGGFERLAYRLQNLALPETRQLLAPYGIDVQVDGEQKDLSPQAITDCVPRFPSSDRGRTHLSVGGTGTNVFIDAYGRPYYAYKWFARLSRPITTRRTACQTTVGTWGVAGDNGGHLVAASLGGYGGRANIVPQSGSFNRGPWYTVEYRAGRCARSGRRTGYQAFAFYSGSTSIRPYAMRQFFSIYNGTRPFRQADITYNNRAATTEMRADATAVSNAMRPYCP